MRKLLLLLISFCYLASSSGVAVQWHYCMGKLRSVDIGITNYHETCGKCGMAKKEHKCCNDSVNISKLTDDHQQSNYSIFDFLQASVALQAQFVSFEAKPFLKNFSTNLHHYSPPDLPGSRHILFCVFRC